MSRLLLLALSASIFSACGPVRAQDLCLAVSQGNVDSVKTILAARPDLVDRKDPRGWAPIHWATLRGNMEITHLLIEAGCDLEATNVYGSTPLGTAMMGRRFEMVKLLVEMGAQVNTNRLGGSPLHTAVYFKQAETVSYLLDQGARLEPLGNDEASMLQYAIEFGDLDMVRLLIERGADVNRTRSNGVGPLHLAAAYGVPDIAALLLDHGADPNAVAEVWGTPLQVAEAGNHPEVTALLRQRGARMRDRAFPRLRGEYLGQEPPGDTPRLFAPGILKSVHSKISAPAFSPNGREVYWCAGGTHDANLWIWCMIEEEGGWTPPRRASFSERLSEREPFLSVDGSHLYYTSRRPIGAGTERNTSPDVWVVGRRGAIWTEPAHLDTTINSGFPDIASSIDRNGAIYFARGYAPDGAGGFDIYRADPIGEGYGEAVNLGPACNTSCEEYFPAVAPDGRCLVFGSDRPGGFGKILDLYVSFRRDDGTWTGVQNLGETINALNPSGVRISPEGRYLFFTATDGVYWVSMASIRALRTQADSGS